MLCNLLWLSALNLRTLCYEKTASLWKRFFHSSSLLLSLSSGLSWGDKQALLFQGADCLGTQLKSYLLAIANDGLLLKVWVPNFLGVALREANVATELLTFAGQITFTHYYFVPYIQVYILTAFALIVNRYSYNPVLG